MRLVYKLLSIIIYICILMYFSGFHFLMLINIKEIFLVIIGASLLSIVYYRREYTRNDICNIVGKNALVAGYIETFVLLFVRLNDSIGYQNILSDIALNCRPVLYGYILSNLLQTDDKNMKSENVDIEDGKEAKLTDHTITDLFDLLKDKGLTTRELEIARLILSSYSNSAIAEELYISEATVKKHVSHIFDKLQISKREQLKDLLHTEKVR